MNKNSVLSTLTSQKEIIFSTYHLTSLGLFGSVARGEESEQSDIDLIYDFENGVEDIIELKSNLRHYFEQLFHTKIDLCRGKYMKPFVKEIIEKEAIYV